MRISDSIIERFAVPTEEQREEVEKLLRDQIEKSGRKIVVLDDDPTGVQTVHDISVYTDWKPESMCKAFREKNRLFYVLTNSRGLTEEETEKAHREIAASVDGAAKECGMDYFIISRSDSTLRGHYPLETQILREEYEKRNHCVIDGEIICPFFQEGGRFTIHNIHYVRYGSELVPANETEFARDKTFGYTADTMPGYVEEKTKGAYKAEDVICIDLEDIRAMNIDKMKNKLLQVSGFQKVVVNAVDYLDLKIFCVALYQAMEAGKRFMFRTAAAFVKVIGGIPDKSLLGRGEMVRICSGNGGLIVVGSHTDKTTAQLEKLKELQEIAFVELDVTDAAQEGALEAKVRKCIAEEEEKISGGITVCCYTTRKEQTADTGDKEDELKLATKISAAVQKLVGELSVTPSFIVAKGGITSSDIGTKALKVRRADVMGQIQPGIPVWKTGRESRFPDIPYVIFPGNVGEDDTLRKVADILMEG